MSGAPETIASLLTTQKELSFLIGVSGHEQTVAQYVSDRLADCMDKVWTDRIGNVLAVREGSKGGRRILVDAHMDEVGFVVRHVEPTGFARISLLGSIDAALLPGCLVQFAVDGDEPAFGVIGFAPPHLRRAAGAAPATRPRIEDLHVDIGEESAAGRVRVGTTGTFYTPFVQLDGQLVAGKAFDNRSGCNVLLHALAGLKDQKVENTLLASFTVQEEVGCRGAAVAAAALEPEAALVLENTVANDVPGTPADQVITRLGAGPAVTISDGTAIVPPAVREWITSTADENKIPWQYKMPGVGGTNAGRIATSGPGVAAGVISVPSRYIHGPAAMVHLGDVHNCVRLVSACLGS